MRTVGAPVLLTLALAVLLALGLFAGSPPIHAAGARGDLQAAEQPGEPTPAPAEGAGGGVSPVVCILVLLAPLAFIAWKSRGKKQPAITSGACLPVIDESKQPFRIHEE